MAPLGDPDAPFRFKKGDRVAWVRLDGAPDLEFAGEITDGLCEYQPRRSVFKAVYLIKRDDGSVFAAHQLDLIRCST